MGTKRFSSSFALLLLVSCYVALSVASQHYIDAPIDGVSAYNTRLAPSLMHFTSNLGKVNEREPSVFDPVIFADVKMLAALPSVDSRVSSNHPPSFLWAWGERHSEEESAEFIGDPRCAPDTVHLISTAEPYADFNFSFSLPDNRTRKANATGNPLPSQFTKAELNSFQPEKLANGSAKPMLLNATISGKVYFPYLKSATYHSYSCWWECDEDGNCYEACGCTSSYVSEDVVFERSLSDTKQFEIENGNTSLFLLHPILREQLHDSSFASVAAFSKRLPHKLYFRLDGKTYNAGYTYFFNISTDRYGAQHVMSFENYTPGMLSADEGIGEILATDSNFSLASSRLHMAPIQLEPSNESFSQEYNANASFSTRLGRHELAFVYFDHFNDNYAINWSILEREATMLGIEVNDGSALVSLKDIHGAPLQGKRISITAAAGAQDSLTDSSGKARFALGKAGSGGTGLGAEFKGDERYRPSSSSISLWQAGSPDFSAFGILGLFVCFGAVSIFLSLFNRR